MTLLDLNEGDVAVVSKLAGGKGLVARLCGFGLFEGVRVRVVKSAPFHGPLLVEDLTSGARMMISRGMATKVEVSDEDAH